MCRTSVGGQAVMTQAFPDGARFVRRVFVIALITLVIPSRLITVARSPDLDRTAGVTIWVLLLWWLLYRVCLRARLQTWFTATSMVALYIVVFGPPMYGWGILLLMTLVHGFVTRHFPAPEAVSGPEAVPIGPETAEDTAEEPGRFLGIPPIKIVDLDPICTPYGRILFSLRMIRAATAATVAFGLWLVAGTLYVAVADGMTAAVLAVLGSVGSFALCQTIGLCFWWRALWQGSVRAARIGAWVSSTFAALSAILGVATVTHELLLTGAVWSHLAAFALTSSVFAALAAGNVTLVRCRGDEVLMSILRQNARHTRRETLQQLFGIVLPRHRSLAAIAHRSVLLSALAFFIEGTAFYVLFNASRTLHSVSDIMVRAAPGKLAPLEANYFGAITIAAMLFPVMYVSTQVTLAIADRLRNAARRASVRPAEELLREDERPPILFFRDYTDDQVSLDRAALPRWIRAIDPGAEQANLEDVMQAYSWVGPIVALGRSYDAEPPVGAARRYVPDEAWKGIVSSMMDGAGAIVVGVSESPGGTVGGGAGSAGRTPREECLRATAYEAE